MKLFHSQKIRIMLYLDLYFSPNEKKVSLCLRSKFF